MKANIQYRQKAIFLIFSSLTDLQHGMQHAIILHNMALLHVDDAADDDNTNDNIFVFIKTINKIIHIYLPKVQNALS